MVVHDDKVSHIKFIIIIGCPLNNDMCDLKMSKEGYIYIYLIYKIFIRLIDDHLSNDDRGDDDDNNDNNNNC